MEFDEVSLVTRPANQHSTVVLFKSDQEAGMPELEEAQAKIEDVRKNGLLDSEVVEYIDTLEKANETLYAALNDVADPEVSGEDDILKSADPRIVELVKSAEERAVVAETIAKGERERREDAEFLAKAEELTFVPGETNDIADILKAATNHLDGETLASFMDLLGKVNSMIEAGSVLDEIGKTTSTPATDSYTEITKRAEALRAEDPTLTEEAAITKVVSDNPDLYTAHTKEG